MKKRISSPFVAGALDNFRHLEDAIRELMSSVYDTDSKIIIPEQQVYQYSPLPVRNDFDKLKVAVSDLWYRFDEDAVTTRKYVGVVICDHKTMEAVKVVNERKDAFAESVRAMRESTKDLNAFREAMSELCSTREELVKMGMGRVNLNQCYRHIHLFDDMPSKIQYSYSTRERSIRRVTIEEAQMELLSFNKGEQPPHIQIQLEKLAGLRPGTPLAVVRNLSTQIKVNLFYPSAAMDDDKLMPITRKPGLPIFVLDNGCTPDIRFQRKNKRKEDVKTRDDIRIESECFLPSISCHRYINNN